VYLCIFPKDIFRIGWETALSISLQVKCIFAVVEQYSMHQRV
jgi:hypothetical protein